MIFAVIVGVLFAGAAYFMLHRDRLRVILGFILLGHAANLLIFAAGGTKRRNEPLGDGLDPATTADPLPQAMVLTAIVIAFAITMYLLVLAITGQASEDEEDDRDPEIHLSARPPSRANKNPVGTAVARRLDGWSRPVLPFRGSAGTAPSGPSGPSAPSASVDDRKEDGR